MGFGVATCSTAKSNAITAWNNKFNGAVTTYCNCANNQKNWSASASTDLDCSSHESLVVATGYIINYNNPCGSSKSITVSASNGYSTLASESVSIPTGVGALRGSLYWSNGAMCGDVSVSGRGSGSC